MEYCILNEIKLVNGNVNFTPLGYLINMEDCALINSNYESTYGNWIDNNRLDLQSGAINISVFFDTTPAVYEAHQITTSVEGMGLNEITDINPYI